MHGMKSGLFALIILLLISCDKNYKPRNFTSVRFQTFTIDSTSIRAITAINDSTVYFAGSNGKFGYTNNNGLSWNIRNLSFQDSLPPYFRSIAHNYKKQQFFALSIGNPALLYKIDSENLKIVHQEKHEKVFYDSMKFFDELNGIAMGDPTEDCLSILITKNGGETWNKIPCEFLPKVEDGEAAFAASNTNIKVINSTAWIVTGGKKARVFRSTDYGKNWEVFETPIVQGEGPQGIYSVDFADEMNGIVIGGDYSKPAENKANVAITKDGGSTWKLVADGFYPNYKSCVQYVPRTQGKELFAVGKTGVAYSNDGGINWKHVSDESYYAIDFVDTNTAWLSGNQKIGKLVLPD